MKYFFLITFYMIVQISTTALAGIGNTTIQSGKIQKFDQRNVKVIVGKTVHTIPRANFSKDTDIRADKVVFIRVPVK